MTEKITEKMTDGQRKQLKRFLEDGLSAFTANELEALDLTKEEAQEIIAKGDLMQAEMKTFLIALLKKHAIIDKRFGPSIIEFDVTVPMDYNHDTYIDTRGKEVRKLKNTYYYNDALTSANFAKATNKMVPGKTYRAKIYPILETVNSDDCMNFLKRQRAILVGGQGVMLAQSQHGDKFPKDKWAVSFDEKEALWKDAGGDHRVPRVGAHSGGGFEFSLGIFEVDWNAGNCLLCFCEIN